MKKKIIKKSCTCTCSLLKNGLSSAHLVGFDSWIAAYCLVVQILCVFFENIQRILKRWSNEKKREGTGELNECVVVGIRRERVKLKVIGSAPFDESQFVFY